jgi:hypothetical protein
MYLRKVMETHFVSSIRYNGKAVQNGKFIQETRHNISEA